MMAFASRQNIPLSRSVERQECQGAVGQHLGFHHLLSPPYLCFCFPSWLNYLGWGLSPRGHLRTSSRKGLGQSADTPKAWRPGSLLARRLGIRFLTNPGLFLHTTTPGTCDHIGNRFQVQVVFFHTKVPASSVGAGSCIRGTPQKGKRLSVC